MNAWPKFICCLVTASACLLLPRVDTTAQSESCGFLESPQTLNTVEGDGTIVIGRVQARPYIVLITSDLQENLPIVRTCIPDAFLTSSSLGRYIHVASFDNYREAKALVNDISDSLNLDAQLIHRNRLRR